MSHFTSIQTRVRDIDALRDACGELGLQLLGNAQVRGYRDNNIPGEFVIRLKGPYDIALNREPNGTYALTTDWWDGHVEREVGSNFGRLLQLYAVHKTTRDARAKGYSVRRQAQKDGSIKLCVEGV